MGEVRKRKASDEKQAASPKPVASEAGGLGLIPVVLIAAILAGSGCYVIKRDHAESFADIQSLTSQLKTDNAKTLKAVDAMKKAIDQKDAIIKELQSKVNAGNEKNRLMEERMGDLNELLESTEEKLKTDIDSKYEDNMAKIKAFASEIGGYSNNILQSNNRLDKTDEKLQDVMDQLAVSTEAASTRQVKIESLESILKETKDNAAASTEELKKLVEEKTGDSGELEIQAAALGEVTGQIDELNAKIQEGATKIAKLDAANVVINDKISKVQSATQSADAAINEIKSVGGADLEKLKTALPALQSQVDSFSEQLEEISSSIPSETLLVTLQTSTAKTAEKLSAALSDVSENSEELRTLKAHAEKELLELSARIVTVVDDVKKGGSVVTSLNDSVDSANQIIGALTKDIDSLKKRFSDLSKKVGAK